MAYLGIEIGGTKTQLAVGNGITARLIAERRTTVEVAAGAQGILQQIDLLGRELIAEHRISAVGVGFGGPIDTRTGVVAKSHQIAGWDGFRLLDWLQERFAVPAAVGNDCNVAALAEARWGAGQGHSRVFYVTVGTGVGGGFVIDERIDASDRPASAEIGHLRPGLAATQPTMTVESLASGWGIAQQMRNAIDQPAYETARHELLQLAGLAPTNQLSAQHVALAAEHGHKLALIILEQATTTLGWAIAQMITLLAPQVVVIGGGVSLMPEAMFMEPVRKAAASFVFSPLANSYQILPAALEEAVVLHGAIALAAGTE